MHTQKKIEEKNFRDIIFQKFQFPKPFPFSTSQQKKVKIKQTSSKN